MDTHKEILKLTIKNYSASSPWPEADKWHDYTRVSEKAIVNKWLSQIDSKNKTILNAGSGGTEYKTEGELIHFDIVDSYIKQFDNHMVGSIESIELPCNSVDGVLCVGSVLNYVDAQRSISEFSRIIRPGGFFIIEFERSNSAEFLFTKNHNRTIFSKVYHYNKQTHILWLYSERHIRQTLAHYGLYIKKCKRIHVLSSLFNWMGVSEENAVVLSRFDSVFAPLSYPLAHNVLLFGTKQFSTT